MKIIGLCGGSGSGKGVVCSLFRKREIPTIDTDLVYRELASAPGPMLDALAEEFGSEIITADGGLNRRALADLVFGRPDTAQRLAILNKISHKYILDETRTRLHAFSLGGAALAIVDAPVLFESGFNTECDAVICVIADKETRIKRIMERDALTRGGAEKRISSQMSDAELLSKCDYAIYNDSDIESVDTQVGDVLSKLL